MGGPLGDETNVAATSHMMSLEREPSGIHRLLDVWAILISELDERVVLDCVLEAAREITGARYAAVTILNDERTQLLRLLSSEVDGATHRSIEQLACGTAVLRAPIMCSEPSCIADAGGHPRDHACPHEHAATRSFLGAPLVMRGEVLGTLHLSEKVEGEFTEADQQGAVILARWGSIAIENARLYEASNRRPREAARVARGRKATPVVPHRQASSSGRTPAHGRSTDRGRFAGAHGRVRLGSGAPGLVVARRRGNPTCPRSTSA